MQNNGRSHCHCQQPKPFGMPTSEAQLFDSVETTRQKQLSPYPITNPAVSDMELFTEGVQSLHFALTNMKPEQIQQILIQNPEAVQEKGFNGQTPLHKAVISCDIIIIDLLLQFKADPNAENNFLETPFHFACKRGNPQIMNLLLQNNANIKQVDQAGKGPIHQAVHGGSVLALHFLTDACGLSTHVRDANLSTPLHVVCAHGHTEALNYLLRKDRSDLFAHNAHGNNALHIAASAGNAWTCWRLLEEGGLELLHKQNREGYVPLDLIKNKRDLKYRDTLNLLQYYTFSKQMSGRAEGPVLGWYCHAILPLAAYPLIMTLAQLTSRPGAISLAGLIVLIIILYQHSHRLNHICRWPNPMFFTLFLSGLIYSMACFYFSVLPVIYADNQMLIQVMIIWNVLTVYTYYVLLTRDPGIAKESARKPDSPWPYTVQDIADGTLRNEALCVHCELIPPRMTHHCKLCGFCYLETDHHCLFLYRCIARNNHRLFVGFVLMTVIGMMLFLFSMKIFFSVLLVEADTSITPLAHIFNCCPWQWSLFIGNILSLFWGINLLRYQLVIISKAHTTAYQPNGGKTSLSGKQRLYNVIYFVMGWGRFATDVEFTA